MKTKEEVEILLDVLEYKRFNTRDVKEFSKIENEIKILKWVLSDD